MLRSGRLTRRKPLLRGKPLERGSRELTRSSRPSYRQLRDGEADPDGEPLTYKAGGGRLMLRWRVAPNTFVERQATGPAGELLRWRPSRQVSRIDTVAAARRVAAGETLEAVGADVGISPSQLSRLVRREGVTPRHGGKPLVELDPDTVLSRYNNGEGYANLARDLGASQIRVRRILEDAGVLLRPPGRVKGRGTGGVVAYRTEFDAMKPIVRARSEGRCEALISPRCSGVGTHVHHLLMRSQGGTNELDNLLDVCIWCHAHIHSNTGDSYDRGLLRHR